MNVLTLSRRQLEAEPLEGDCYAIIMKDPGDDWCSRVPSKFASKNVTAVTFEFNDATESYGTVQAPDAGLAKEILRLAMNRHDDPCDNLVFCCTAGVGRSHAAAAAWLKINGQDNSQYLERGTYNKLLYRLMLEAAGLSVEPEPLVSIVVRVKYDYERINAFLHCLRRQRHANWELIAVTDGPVKFLPVADEQIRLIETTKPLGRWGHPYRQLGIDAARGQYIGLNNDDNYLTPGYIEQLVYAMQSRNVPLALCGVAHSYSGWAQTPPGSDLGAWLARSELVKGSPWTGTDFTSDAEYLKLLKAKAGKWAEIPKPLLVHN